LIVGETGTGKELCARAIHHLSPRADHPFVPVNCGAIPVDLVENELFGHESGAYTSANTSVTGLVQQAEGGTLFLDEIDCLPPSAQVKLLRFLQDKEFRPLGGQKVRKADLRVVAATNAEPHEAVEKGRMRQDLYYRLSGLTLNLPPLRKRVGDVPLLARHFEAKFTEEFAKPSKEFAPAAMQKLLSYPWPGNVRELENVVQATVILCEHSAIQPEDIRLRSSAGSHTPETFRAFKARTIAELERSYFCSLLAAHHGNVTKAAAAAGIARQAAQHLMRKHRLTADQWRSHAPEGVP
jgi:DNA-binding NtrC family response regulator